MKDFFKKNKLFKFIIVGGISTCIDFIVYMFISSFIDINISKIISMICASVFSYILNKKWTFEDKTKTDVAKILKYIMSQIINITANTGINCFFYNITKNKIISFVVATGIAMCINFLIQRIIVFKEKKK